MFRNRFALLNDFGANLGIEGQSARLSSAKATRKRWERQTLLVESLERRIVLSVTAEVTAQAEGTGQIIPPNDPGDPTYTIDGDALDTSVAIDDDEYLITLNKGDTFEVVVDYFQDVVLTVTPPNAGPDDEPLLNEISHDTAYDLTAPVSGVYTFEVDVRVPPGGPYTLNVTLQPSSIEATPLSG